MVALFGERRNLATRWSLRLTLVRVVLYSRAVGIANKVVENAKLLWSFYGPGLHVKNCEVGGWVEGWLCGHVCLVDFATS